MAYRGVEVTLIRGKSLQPKWLAVSCKSTIASGSGHCRYCIVLFTFSFPFLESDNTHPTVLGLLSAGGNGDLLADDHEPSGLRPAVRQRRQYLGTAQRQGRWDRWPGPEQRVPRSGKPWQPKLGYREPLAGSKRAAVHGKLPNEFLCLSTHR
jgi:hypothetical protein